MELKEIALDVLNWIELAKDIDNCRERALVNQLAGKVKEISFKGSFVDGRIILRWIFQK